MDGLNERRKALRKKIVAQFKASPSQVTPRRSPRKSLTTPGRDGPPRATINSNEATGVGTPTRRSSRATFSLYGTNNSPTKSPLPPPWKKGPVRELPSKDSPKKHSTEAQQQSVTNNVPDEPQTPKRRKPYPVKLTRSDSTSAFLAAFGSSPAQGSAVHSPTKSPAVSSPLKRSYAVAIATDVPSETSESELEDSLPRARFRPVYFEHRQWNGQDPLVASIWKRAEKLRAQQNGLKPSRRRRKTTAIAGT